mmetsp:Transcript_60689/g.198674  ORF Transcript_60689/g.198674 Transcript_60689/m.198674 type:complete len:164 (+) Transcript_60689:71-562(+)
MEGPIGQPGQRAAVAKPEGQLGSTKEDLRGPLSSSKSVTECGWRFVSSNGSCTGLSRVHRAPVGGARGRIIGGRAAGRQLCDKLAGLLPIPEHAELGERDASDDSQDECSRDVTPMFIPGIRDHSVADDGAIARLLLRRQRSVGKGDATSSLRYAAAWQARPR